MDCLSQHSLVLSLSSLSPFNAGKQRWSPSLSCSVATLLRNGDVKAVKELTPLWNMRNQEVLSLRRGAHAARPWSLALLRAVPRCSCRNGVSRLHHHENRGLGRAFGFVNPEARTSGILLSFFLPFPQWIKGSTKDQNYIQIALWSKVQTLELELGSNLSYVH